MPRKGRSSEEIIQFAGLGLSELRVSSSGGENSPATTGEERDTADRKLGESRSPLLSHAAIAAGLCVLVIAAYANAFSTGFVLDSQQLVLNDPRVHAATAENVGLIINRSYWWPYGESGLYRPLTTLSYLLNYAVLGSAERPAGYHWFNLVIHILNVWLVWSLARQITGQRAAAIAAAAIWSVLPLSTEAVTNIVGRADLLAALGVLGGLASYMKARATTGALRMTWLAGLMLMTAVGVFAKESAVAIPASSPCTKSSGGIAGSACRR